MSTAKREGRVAAWSDVFPTPWGWVGAAYTERGLRRLCLPSPRRGGIEQALLSGAGPLQPRPWPALRRAVRAYLAGRREPLRLPLDPGPATPFTARVRAAARRIPRGATVSYAELAARAGSPGAARAAGQAMARNPIPLFIPCHRVVAARGTGGFAGGRAMKRRLLALEAREGRRG